MAKSLSLPSLPFKSPTSIRTHPSQRRKISCSSISIQSQSAKDELLTLISDQDRGLKTQKSPQKLASIVKSIDALAYLGRNSVTTDDSLSATWRLLWTTEKEQLFIIEKAHLFGTQAGDVLQVIDVEKKTLNNVITFPPDGVFFVRSSIEVASSQRVNFRFTSAVLRGKNWEIPLPPFGQGWFQWLREGDENTKIFHHIVAARKRKSSIMEVLSCEGHSLFTAKEIEAEFIDFYQTLYTKDNSHRSP